MELDLIVDDECDCSIEGWWVFLELCCVELSSGCVNANLKGVVYGGGVVASLVSSI